MGSRKSRPWPCFSPLVLFPFFIFFSLKTHISLGTDTFSAGQSLSGNHTIVSNGGKFELGFFTPGSSNNYYIGIWYKNLPNQTVIWVANRAAPVSSPSSAELKLSADGNLALQTSNNFTTVWSSNTGQSSSAAVTAVLLDTGNLVLRNGSSSMGIIWQSFDHPTDTWMPGGWLGMSKITGEYQSITCWESPENPAPGRFAQSLDPDGSNQYVILWNGSRVYWSSGLWTGLYFSAVPIPQEQTAFENPFNFTFIETKDRKYAMYTMRDSSVITRYVVEPTGQTQQWWWLSSSQQWQPIFTRPQAPCDVFSVCGPFGICDTQGSSLCRCSDGFVPASTAEWELGVWSSGCVRKTLFQCGNNKTSAEGEQDGFLMISNLNLPSNPQSLAVSSAEGCKVACSSNCSCTACSFDHGRCVVWAGDLRNMQQLHGDGSGGGSLYLRLAASDLPRSSSSNKLVIIVTSSVGLTLLALVVLVVPIWMRRRWKRSHIISKVKDSPIVRFSYSDLLLVTRNFSEKLGGGGFGSVFKGALPDMTQVAVKKLEGFKQGEKQFRAEVSTLGLIQHVNLVRLRGYCSTEHQRLLVYEFMAGGSLDYHLFRKDTPPVIDWKTRYRIILGMARGLAYLHEECRACIIHCDIKPDNILLDSGFCAKVADFGMAKLVGRDFSRVLTTFRGTVGYLAPEWIAGVPITPKVDVYSFGMTLFEVISGQRNSVGSEDGSKVFFPSWAARQVREGNIVGILDSRLHGEADVDELSRAFNVACWCIQYSEAQRPTMGQVVKMLEGLVEVGVPPLPRVLELLVEEDQSSVG